MKHRQLELLSLGFGHAVSFEVVLGRTGGSLKPCKLIRQVPQPVA